MIELWPVWERAYAAVYGGDLMDELQAGRSWRWLGNRLIGILERDTSAATIVEKRHAPRKFEAWLEARAVRKE